jgi:hypothetical protein
LAFADIKQKHERAEAEKPLASHCVAMYQRHNALISLVQKSSRAHVTSFLEESSGAFNPEDFVDKVKTVIVLLMDTDELLKLIKARIESYEEPDTNDPPG